MPDILGLKVHGMFYTEDVLWVFHMFSILTNQNPPSLGGVTHVMLTLANELGRLFCLSAFSLNSNCNTPHKKSSKFPVLTQNDE
jgi:hypothetical protein